MKNTFNIIEMEDITLDNFEKIETIPLEEVEKYILYANEKYHTGTPIMSDELYDKILEYLSNVKSNSKVLKVIGERRKKGFKKLPVFLGSEDKTYEADGKLYKWLKKRFSQDDEVIISAKADGICLLVYDNKIYTRGNGIYGRDISNLGKYIFTSDITKLRIRGELIISRENFDKINRSNKKFKNPRNLVCGQINRKNPDLKMIKDFTFLGYDVIDNNMDQEKKFEFIDKNGIRTVEHKKVHVKDLTYEYLKDVLSEWKDKLEYNIDGLVLRDNKPHDMTIVENNKFYPWSMSYKYNFNNFIGHVISVEWNISRKGKLIPVALLSPSVLIDGTSISRVTCNNAKYVIDNKIGKGSIIQITKSGDIIPHIIQVKKPGTLELPKNSLLIGVHLYAKINNHEINIKKIHYFLKFFKFNDIGIKILNKINETYKLSTIFSFLRLKNKNIDFIGDVRSQKIISIIEHITTKKIHITDILVACSLFSEISIKRLDIIFTTYPDIYLGDESDIYQKILKIKGVKTKIADDFVKGIMEFKSSKTKFEKYFNIDYNKKEENLSLNQKIIYISVSGFRNISDIQEQISKRYKIIETTLSKSEVLVVKKISKSNKIESARKRNLPILMIDEFINLYKE